MLAMIFAAIQFPMAYTNRAVLVHAAGVGAYQGAVTRSAASCVAATRGASVALKQSSLGVTCLSSWVKGETVQVTVTYPWRISLILFDRSGTFHYTTTDVVR